MIFLNVCSRHSVLLISYLHWVVAFIILFVILEIVIINTSRRANNGERIVFRKGQTSSGGGVLYEAPVVRA